MSEVINKATGKTYSSKSVNHILSYKPVKSTKEYLLTYGVINYIYAHVFSIWNLVDENVISKYSVVSGNLSSVDGTFDSLVLGNFDNIISKLPDLSYLNPFSVYNKLKAKVNGEYLHPANEYIYNSYDKYLPSTIGDNKIVFKIEDLKEFSEVTKFFKIVNEFLRRSRLYVSTKSGDVADNLLSNYQKEVESLNEKKDGISKNVLASYNTGYKALKSINDGYIRPLKSQTQGYVVDVATSTKNRADSFLSEAKQQISPRINAINNRAGDILNEGTSAETPQVNGTIPVVSASA